MSPDLGQQFLLGCLSGFEPAFVVPDVPAAEDKHCDPSRPTWSAPEKKSSFLKGEDYLTVPPTLVHMPVCRDPDDDGRNVPERTGQAFEPLPRPDLSRNEAALNLGSGSGRVTAALAGGIRAVPANHRKGFVDALVGDHVALHAGSWGTVEVPMIPLPMVTEYP